MRSLGALLCGIGAVIMFLVAVPAWWTAEHVTSSERFIELMGPVSVDDGMHESLAHETSRLLLENHDVAPSVAESVQSATTRATRALASTEEFAAVWDRIVADSRDATLADDAHNRLYVDLSSLSARVVESMEAVPGFTLRAPADTRIAVSRQSHPKTLFFARRADAIAWTAAVIAVLLAATAVWLARSRPGAVLFLGLSSFASIALLRLTWDLSVPKLLSEGSADSALAQTLLSAASRQMTLSFHSTLTFLAVIAAIVVVVAGIWRLARPPAATSQPPNLLR